MIKSYCVLCAHCGEKKFLQTLLVSILSFIFFIPSDGISQNENPDLIERTTEKLSETSDKPIDFSEVSDVLDRFQNHPMNNSANSSS
jgi:hypothetical protein